MKSVILFIFFVLFSKTGRSVQLKFVFGFMFAKAPKQKSILKSQLHGLFNNFLACMFL